MLNNTLHGSSTLLHILFANCMQNLDQINDPNLAHAPVVCSAEYGTLASAQKLRKYFCAIRSKYVVDQGTRLRPESFSFRTCLWQLCSKEPAERSTFRAAPILQRVDSTSFAFSVHGATQSYALAFMGIDVNAALFS